jgi:hypothetical protein
VTCPDLALFNPGHEKFDHFILLERKRKKRWIGLNLRVMENLLNYISEKRNSNYFEQHN